MPAQQQLFLVHQGSGGLAGPLANCGPNSRAGAQGNNPEVGSVEISLGSLQ
jgi:hypothetical protein